MTNPSKLNGSCVGCNSNAEICCPLDMGKMHQYQKLQQCSLSFQVGANNKIHNESEGHLEGNLVIPPLSKDWNDEYLFATFQPRAFRAVAFLMTVFSFCMVVYILAH
jgi:hypothetical protein